jgi:pimeloyl-ACP methyl ester carboxylesterase
MGLNGAPMNPADFADNINAPTLLLTGEHDPRGLPHEVEAIRARLGGPAELVVFPGAGHVGLHSADAALWRSSISTFLNREAPHTGRDLGVRTPPPTP